MKIDMTPLAGAALVTAALVASIVPVASTHAVAASAASAEARDGQPTAAPPHWVVAVSGKGHALFANDPGTIAMHDLGGKLIGAPAVTASNGNTFFVADLAKTGLSVRSTVTGWQPLVKGGGVDCRQPEVTSVDNRLAVVCLRHHTVFAQRMPAPAGAALPVVKKLKSLGGHFGIGPAVFFITRQVIGIEEVGTLHAVGKARYDTFFRHFSGKVGFQADNQFRCFGQQTHTSTDQYDEPSVYGCVARHGQLRVDVNGENGFSSVPTAGTAQAGRIGLTFGTPLTETDGTYIAYTQGDGKTAVRTLDPSILDHGPGPVQIIYDHAHGGAAITSVPVD